MNKTKSWLIERINKTGKSPTRLTKKRERIQISEIRNGKGDITTDTAEIQKTIRVYYEQLYAKKKIQQPRRMDKFLETYSPPKLNKNR